MPLKLLDMLCSLILFTTFIKLTRLEKICKYYTNGVENTRTCKYQCCEGINSYNDACCTGESWWVGLIIFAGVAIIGAIVLTVICCKKKRVKCGQLECPTFRNKSRTKPLSDKKKDSKKVKSEQKEKKFEKQNENEIEKRHNEEPDQLSAEPYIDYHKPCTIEVEKDNEEPLPRLPAPIDFK